MSELLRLPEVARMHGVATGTVRYWVKTGRLAAVRTPGGQFRVRREDAERAMVEVVATPKDQVAA